MQKYLSNNLILRTKADLTNAEKAPISNGRYIVVEETKEIYYDSNDTRSKLRDIQIYQTEAECAAATVYNNDMVFVVESCKIYYYMQDGSRIEVNQTVYIGPDEPTNPAIQVWINPEGQTCSIIDNLYSTSGTDVLSANQGRVLKGLCDDLDEDRTALLEACTVQRI